MAAKRASAVTQSQAPRSSSDDVGRSDRAPRPTPRKNPYLLLKSAILDGTFEPGSPLVEVQIAEWCGVSRTPVREALAKLEADGLVEKGDRGFVVRATSIEEILDIYQVRVVLEALVAETAAKRHSSLDDIRMQHALETWQKAAEAGDSPADLSKLSQQFHRCVWRASHNGPLIDLLERASLHLHRYPSPVLRQQHPSETSFDEHQRILDAVVAGSAAAAAEAATAHFTRALNLRLELFKEESLDS